MNAPRARLSHPTFDKLKLIFALELRADATGRRADTVHERRLIMAQLLLESPALAVLIVIHAASSANAARLGAILHHSDGVVQAFIGVCPDVALRTVLVLADGAF